MEQKRHKVFRVAELQGVFTAYPVRTNEISVEIFEAIIKGIDWWVEKSVVDYTLVYFCCIGYKRKPTYHEMAALHAEVKQVWQTGPLFDITD